jgi:hypothetical protein
MPINPSIELRIRLIYHDHIRRRLAHDRQRQQQRSGKVDRYQTCIYATHSPFLRCTVHPEPECKVCRDYVPIQSHQSPQS